MYEYLMRLEEDKMENLEAALRNSYSAKGICKFN